MSISFAATPQSKEAQQARTYTDPSRGAPPSRRSGANAPYIDKDHWNKVFTEPEYFDSIAKQKGMAEGAKVSLFGDDYVYRQAMMGYLSATRNVPLDDMRSVFDAEKDGFAQKVLGKKTATARELFDWHKTKFERDNEKQGAARQILEGVMERSLQDALSGGDTPFVESVAKDIDAASDFFDDEEKSRLWEKAEELDKKIRATQDRFAPEARFIFDALQQYSGQKEGFGAPDMRELAGRFASLPENQRKAIYELVGGFASITKTDKGFFYQLAESLGRGTTDITERVPRNFREQTLRGQLRLLESDQPVFRATGVAGAEFSAAGSTPVFGATQGQMVTPEEREQAIAKIQADLGVLKVERELRDLAERVVDPIKMTGVLPEIIEEGLYGAAQSIPYTVAAAVPFAGVPAVAAALFSSNYDSIMLEYDGIDPDKAALIAAISAPIEAGLERMKVNTITGRLPVFGGLVKRLQHPNQRNIVRIAIGGAGIMAEQNVQEIVQNATFPFVRTIAAALDEDMPDYDWAERIEGMPRELAVQFVALLPLSLMGIGALSYREISRGESYLRSKDNLERAGYSPEQIDRITGAATADEAQSALREESKKRDPKLVKAAAQRIVDESIALREKANPAALPRLEKQGADYVVLSPDGKELARERDQTAAEQALVSARRETVQREMRDVHTGINEAVEFIKKVNEARQRGEDVAKVIRESAPRTLLTDYEANPTQENLDRLFETVRAFGQEINEPAELASFPVIGSNQGALAEGIWRSVIRINEGADGTIVMREFAQDNLKRAISEGRTTMDFVRQQLNDVLPQIDSNRIKRQLRTDTDTDVIEAFSDVALAYFRGSIREEQIPAGLRGIMRRLAIISRDIFRRAYNLARLRAEGKLDRDFEALLAEAVGVDQQALVDRARERTEQEVGDANYSLQAVPFNSSTDIVPSFSQDLELAAVIKDAKGRSVLATDKQIAKMSDEKLLIAYGGASMAFQNGGDSPLLRVNVARWHNELVKRGLIEPVPAIASYLQETPQNYSISFVGQYVKAKRAIEDSPLADEDASVKRGAVGYVDDYDSSSNLLYVDFGNGAIAVDPNEVTVTANPNYSIAITPQQDTDYLAAVERGDMEMAQRMVDEAARAAGFDIPAVHFTDEDFTAFDLTKTGSKNPSALDFAGDAAWFTVGGPETDRRFADMQKRGMAAAYGTRRINAWVKFTEDDFAREGSPVEGSAIAITDPTRIKSADPVTYDASGNVIPLSQRFDATTADINYSIVRSVDYLKNDTRFDDLVKDGRVVTGVDVNDFIDQHILLHSPDNAFAGTIQLTDGEQIDGKGGVYYPVLYADKNYFWASTAAMVMRTATHLNEIAAKNGGRVLMGLVSAPVEKLFSSTSMSAGVVKFLNALTKDPRAGLSKDDLNAMLVAASKVEVVVQTKTKTTKKTFSTKLKASDSYAKNLAKIDELLAPDGSIFQVRKAFVESLADQISKHLNTTPATAEYVAGILADAENKHAKSAIKRGKLSKASFLQGLGNMLTEPFLRDFQEHGNGKIYAIVEVQGEVKGIATTEHESYPATIVPVNKKSKVKLHVLKEAVDWQDVVGKETGQYATPQERLNLLPTSGMSSTSLKVLGVKAGSSAAPLNYSIATSGEMRDDRGMLPIKRGDQIVQIGHWGDGPHEQAPDQTASIYVSTPLLLKTLGKKQGTAMNEATGYIESRIRAVDLGISEGTRSSKESSRSRGYVRADDAAGIAQAIDLFKSQMLAYVERVVAQDEKYGHARGVRHNYYKSLISKGPSGIDVVSIELTGEGGTNVLGPYQAPDNYSISTQREIDRVSAAMGALDRSPLSRLKVYEKMQERFLRVMSDNRETLAAMEGDLSQVRRTQILQALGELDGIISALPTEIRAKIGGYTQLAKVDPMDVFKGDQKVSEVRGMSGAIISAWMREGLNIGQAQKKTELPAGYRADRNLDPTRADRAIADVFIQRINRINEALEKFLRDEYNDAAVELFKRAKPQRSGAGEKPKGKLGADVHALFDTLKEATEWSAEKAQAMADAELMRADSGELNPYDTNHAFMAAHLLRLFGNWANADSTQRASAVAAGLEVLNKAYKGEQQRIIAQRTKRGYDRTDLSKDAGVSAEDKKARQDAVKRENSLPTKWEAAMLNLLNFDQVLRYVFGNDSKIAQKISDRQRKADNVKSDDIAALSDDWASFLTRLGGGEMQGQQLLFDLSRMDEEIDDVSYSQNQLVAITMMWMQPKGRQHMEGFMDSDGQPAGKWHYNQAFVNKAEKLLRPESKVIREYLLLKYDQEYEAINKVYRKVYGLNLPKNQFYSPLSVDPINAPAQAGIDPVTGAVFAAGANSPSALRSRGGAIAEPVFRDAVQTYLGHMLQMAHWKAYAEFNGEVSALLGHRDTRNVVKGKAGEQAATVMNNWMQYFQQGGNKDAANHLAINQMINRITGNFAVMALFGRVSTLALQVTQLGAASVKMPVGAYLSRFGKLMSGNLNWKAALDSDYIQRRIKDMPPAVALAMQGLRSDKPSVIREASRRLGQLISGFDGFFTAGTYAIVYDYQLTQAQKNGMGGQEAADYAREATERIVDEIAQPTRAGTRSIYELNSTNPVARAVWAFSSEARKNFGLALYAGTKGRSGDFGKALFYVLILNGLVSTVIRSAFRDLRDDDDDEIFDEKNWGWNRMAAMLISDPLYGFPVVGEAIESGIFNAFGVYTPSGPLFDVAPAVPAVKRMAYDHPMALLEGEAEYRDILRDVNRILSTAGLFNSTIAGAASLTNLAKDSFEVGDNLLGDDE
jgi:hypothetical protein